MSNYRNQHHQAIVIGIDNHNALGMVRSLGMQGVPVVLIVITESLEKKTGVEYSKYIRTSYRIRDAKDELIPTMLSACSDILIPAVVFPTTDQTAKLIDDNKVLLEGTCIVPQIVSKRFQLADLLNKWTVNQLAKEFGLQIPESFLLQLDGNQIDLPENLTYPCIMKPVSSIEGEKSDIKKLNSKQELLNQIEAIKQSYTRVLIQEYIDGTDAIMVGVIGFVTQEGEVCITGILKKDREYPASTGSTSHGFFSENRFGLELENIKEFIKQTGYYGIFDFDFKYAEGKCYFIEMNFRNGALSYASVAAGVNMPYLWYLDACGQDISGLKQQAKTGIRFMLETRDFRNILHRDVTFFKWLKDFLHTDAFLIFDRRDIKPLFAQILIYAKSLWSK